MRASFRRRSRQLERCFTIQSSRALSKPMSFPAFSLSIHLCFRISSRSARNSLYKTEFLTNSACAPSAAGISGVVVTCAPAGAAIMRETLREATVGDATLRLFKVSGAYKGDVLLISIDPLSSYLGKIDSHNNTEVRAVLERLSEMAARRRVAVVGVTHFNKGEGSAINKIIGSIPRPC